MPFLLPAILIFFCDFCNGKKLPGNEYIIYETYDKGKVGTIEVRLTKDSTGYRLIYRSDRIIEAILDTINLQTLHLNKIVEGRWELSVKKNHVIEVNYRGRKKYYNESMPVYDRHTLDYVLRGFDYHQDFKRRIRLNVPEFMVINADIEVVGEDSISTPVGTFNCWKILMTPRIFFKKLSFYFYIEKAFPYRFVKYTDASGKNSITLKEYKLN
ncbi:MAG: DUF3108 domain-containing protein [candidate division WOR-3 bacterium]|nr:DUF3108 domain-containing protein [candidate division WOR-3 bacterium]